EFTEQLALALGQFLRRLHDDLNVHVAGLFRAEHRHSFAVKPEAAAGLRALRHLHAALAAVDRGHLEIAAQRRRHHSDRYPTIEIGAFALEKRMRGKRQEYVEVAGRAAAHAGFAFAGKPDAGAVLHARGNIDGQRALAGDPPGAGAGRTWTVDDLTAALACGTGALERK